MSVPLLASTSSAALDGDRGVRGRAVVLLRRRGVMTRAGLLGWGHRFYLLRWSGVAFWRSATAPIAVVLVPAIVSIGAGSAWPQWVPLRAADGWLLGGVALFGTLGQVALTHAFRLGEASLVAPLEYTALVWVVLLDVVLWQVLPDAMTWLGAGIIVVSGLYLMRRERVVRAAPLPRNGD